VTNRWRLALIWWVMMLGITTWLGRAAPADPLLALLPQNEAVQGWVRDGTSILCFDEETLAEHIDGAAPFYLERGAVAVLFQYYRNPRSAQELKVEIYQMKNASVARDLFAEIGKGKPSAEDPATKGLGEGRRLEQALLGVYLLEFHQGSFFVRMEAQGEGLPAKAALLRFAALLSSSIQGWAEKAR
jgi:hypothetical protein